MISAGRRLFGRSSTTAVSCNKRKHPHQVEEEAGQGWRVAANVLALAALPATTSFSVTVTENMPSA
uniref:Uncharacterized protein n=1 Tax=Salix viminalis TaxID=40686 RepID=A0A6N2LRA9_SALVM